MNFSVRHRFTGETVQLEAADDREAFERFLAEHRSPEADSLADRDDYLIGLSD